MCLAKHFPSQRGRIINNTMFCLSSDFSNISCVGQNSQNERPCMVSFFAKVLQGYFSLKTNVSAWLASSSRKSCKDIVFSKWTAQDIWLLREGLARIFYSQNGRLCGNGFFEKVLKGDFISSTDSLAKKRLTTTHDPESVKDQPVTMAYDEFLPDSPGRVLEEVRKNHLGVWPHLNQTMSE